MNDLSTYSFENSSVAFGTLYIERFSFLTYRHLVVSSTVEPRTPAPIGHVVPSPILVCLSVRFGRKILTRRNITDVSLRNELRELMYVVLR